MRRSCPLTQRAIQLSPRDPNLGDFYQLIAVAHLQQSRIEDAILWPEKARNYFPAHAAIHRDLAVAYVLRGETERVTAELTKARRPSSDDRYSSIARLKAVYRYSELPKFLALIDATYIAGLRKAGMPEE
jgi:tetratricopeptide (TPR) repeat protein